MEFVDIPATDNPISFMGKLADQQQFEQTIYSKAASLNQCYRGGDWRYIGCGQNTVFMAPYSNEVYDVISPDGTQLKLSSNAFGLLVTLLGMKGLEVDSKYQFLGYRFAKLKGLAKQHSEAESILSCLNTSDGQDE